MSLYACKDCGGDVDRAIVGGLVIYRHRVKGFDHNPIPFSPPPRSPGGSAPGGAGGPPDAGTATHASPIPVGGTATSTARSGVAP